MPGTRARAGRTNDRWPPAQCPDRRPTRRRRPYPVAAFRRCGDGRARTAGRSRPTPEREKAAPPRSAPPPAAGAASGSASTRPAPRPAPAAPPWAARTGRPVGRSGAAAMGWIRVGPVAGRGAPVRSTTLPADRPLAVPGHGAAATVPESSEAAGPPVTPRTAAAAALRAVAEPAVDAELIVDAEPAVERRARRPEPDAGQSGLDVGRPERDAQRAELDAGPPGDVDQGAARPADASARTGAPLAAARPQRAPAAAPTAR